jgi:hypothetical protein
MQIFHLPEVTPEIPRRLLNGRFCFQFEMLPSLGQNIPCEYDYKNGHSFGNTAKLGTFCAWKSPATQRFRRNFNLGHNDSYLCRNCTYKNSVADDCTVERFDIDQP